MDTRRGVIDEQDEILKQLRDETDLEIFEHGEVVQVKSGWFEVTKVDIRKQRVTLKPIPRPTKEQLKDVTAEARAALLRNAATKANEPDGV
jgi:hypothetical protein